jgi:hypothetical protein
VPRAQRLQRALPVRSPRKSETDDDEPAVARDRAAVCGARPARRAGAVGLRLGAQLGQQHQQAEAALRGRMHSRLAAAHRDHAEPVPAPRRDVADRQRDALGDVGLAPVGGAEVIEAETSSSSHAVIARSPTCTRTCGSRIRAVTFQSMWRTSSPGR